MSAALIQDQLPSGRGHWFRLPAEEFARTASLHLLSLPTFGLSAESHKTLQEMTVRQPEKLGQHIQVWVQLTGVEWAAKSQDEADKEGAALELLIRRRANFDLVRHLFKVSRREWLVLRRKIGAEAAPTAWPTYPESFVDEVFSAWLRLLKDYDTEVDRWLELSALFPGEPLACLYPLIYER